MPGRRTYRGCPRMPGMPTHSGRDEDVEAVTYTYRPARDDWTAWKATVPRTTDADADD